MPLGVLHLSICNLYTSWNRASAFSFSFLMLKFVGTLNINGFICNLWEKSVVRRVLNRWNWYQEAVTLFTTSIYLYIILINYFVNKEIESEEVQSHTISTLNTFLHFERLVQSAPENLTVFEMKCFKAKLRNLLTQIDPFPCQLNTEQHCARWLSVWKRRVAGKLVFKFQKPSDFLAHSAQW